jgi:hypothetical protein
MDEEKRQALVSDALKETFPGFVAIERFFDGNDDEGSIGCNLIPHPGIEVFRQVLTGLTKRADVSGVYAALTEIDMGKGSWSFSDTVYVVGKISRNELVRLVTKIEADEVEPITRNEAPAELAVGKGEAVFRLWWD